MSLLFLPFHLIGRLASRIGAHVAVWASLIGLLGVMRQYDAVTGEVHAFLRAGDAATHLLPLGLAYQGGFGFAVALTQATLVLMAYLLSMSCRTTSRRTGRAVLTLWIGLCALGGVTLAQANAVEFGGQAAVWVLFFLATLNRAVAGWRARQPRARCGAGGPKAHRCGKRAVVDVSDTGGRPAPTGGASTCSVC
jgi:hypothetical protein